LVKTKEIPKTYEKESRGRRNFKKRTDREKFEEKSVQLNEIKLQQVSEQIEIFKSNLEAFAKKYKRHINKHPEFRYHFNNMCTKIGVDPLSTSKGFWAEVLGFGDFYYELGIQIIEICIQFRSMNGGLMDIDSVLLELRKRRKEENNKISSNDVERAVTKLKILGEGFCLLSVGSRKMIQSIPCELNNDHTTLLAISQKDGFITKSDIQSRLLWNEERSNLVLELLLKEGIAWIDEVDGQEIQYWFPSIFYNNTINNEKENTSI